MYSESVNRVLTLVICDTANPPALPPACLFVSFLLPAACFALFAFFAITMHIFRFHTPFVFVTCDLFSLLLSFFVSHFDIENVA